MNKLTLQYSAALLAAPLFIFLHNLLFQHQLINTVLPLNDFTTLFLLVLFYPIVEELIFRGMIQEYLVLKTNNKLLASSLSLANVLTSTLFVAIHFIYHTPLWAFMVFIPSLIFGYFKEQYQSIYPSIFLHIFYNICSLFLFI